MQAHINYEAHLRLKNEVEEYLAKGGKINQVKTIHLNGVENASEHQVKEINDWVGKSSSKFKMLQKRVNKKIKNQPTNWLQNTLKGRKKLPLPMYEIIIEEINVLMTNLEKEMDSALKQDWRKLAELAQAEITELKQKLEKLESGEFVLVPRNANDDMWKSGWREFEISESMHKAYNAMIEAVEKQNAN